MESQSESNYTGIYHHAVKSGLFNSTLISKKYIPVNNMLPLVRVNNFFFGTNNFSNNFNYLNLAKEHMVCKEYGIYYLETKKLENYLEYVMPHLKLESEFNVCPYNYYKFMEKIGQNIFVPEHYQVMINTIDNFLCYLDDIDTQQAKTIRNMLTPGTKSGELNKLDWELSDVLVMGNLLTNEFVFKIIKSGNPIFLRLSSQSGHQTDSNVLVLQKEPDKNNYERVYNYINEQLLLDTPEEFLICNIERVCGSRVFAEIMVKSYLNKNDFLFSLESISSIILWKQSETEINYIEYFISKYPDCICKIDSVFMLNFKGINKFLLNITEDDVENFDVKEQINEMYYNSMNELIHSFEQLYKRNVNFNIN